MAKLFVARGRDVLPLVDLVYYLDGVMLDDTGRLLWDF